MKAEDAAQLIRELAAKGIDVWLDGGWAVVALIGQQTRNHDDVDIVIRDSDLPSLLEVLAKEASPGLKVGDPSTSSWKIGRAAERTSTRSSSTPTAMVCTDPHHRTASRRCAGPVPSPGRVSWVAKPCAAYPRNS